MIRKAVSAAARLALVAILIMPSPATAQPCSGCGCRGGPGYRGPNGRCVGWSDIGRVCGSPPTTRCTADRPNAGAEEAAKLGAKAIEASKPKVYQLANPGRIEVLPVNPDVTQGTIQATICVQGWTKTIRPPYPVSDAIKVRRLRAIGLTEADKSRFQLDHRIPLSLGGAPTDPRNFELEPWEEAERKDAVETCLSRAVCSGRITLDEARRRIWADWRAASKACE